MIGEYTVPADFRHISPLLDKNSACVRCGKPLLKGPPPDNLEVDRNALGELIAWCACRHCGKVTPLTVRTI